MSDFWNTVGAEAKDARHAELVEAALIEAAPYRQMLVAASNDADFQNRFQIVAERLDSSIGDIVGHNPAEFALTRTAVIEDARRGYQRNRSEVVAQARRKSLLQKEVLSSLKKQATGRWMVADGPSSYLGEIVMGFPQELIPDPGCFAILTNNTQVYLQGRLTGDTVSEWDTQCPVVEVRRFDTVVHDDSSIWGEPGDVLDGQYFVHPDSVDDLIRPYATASRRTADVEMVRTRSSIPTQLEEAGHTVDTGWDDRLDTLTYIIDGQEMSLVEAADRYLGGWDNAFGKSGSRRTGSSGYYECQQCDSKFYDIEQCSDYDPVGGEFALYCPNCGADDDEFVFYSSPNYIAKRKNVTRKIALDAADVFNANDGTLYRGTGWAKGPFVVVESTSGDYGVVYLDDEDGFDIVTGMSRFDAEDSVERWAANPQTAPFDDTWTNDWDGLLTSSKNASPWGELVMVTRLAPGIFSGYTASRQGGIAVTGKALDHLVKNRRIYASQGIRRGNALWFDDRTGWALVAAMWPKAASPTKSMPPKRIAEFLPQKVAKQYLRDINAGGAKVNARRKGEKR